LRKGAIVKAVLLIGMLAITTTLCAQKPDNNAQAFPNSVLSANAVSGSASRASSGAILSAELTRSLDARKAKPGTVVFAKCTQDLALNGEIVIPRNAKLVGHVVLAQTKGRGKPESMLGIAFDKAVMRDGREVLLTASIQALAPPAILESDIAFTGFLAPKSAPPKPQTSALFPSTLKTVAPESSTAIIAPNATGVVGLKGLQLNDSALETNTSVIHSSSENVRLESGTRLTLRVLIP
jgi:hypothetical protein